MSPEDTFEIPPNDGGDNNRSDQPDDLQEEAQQSNSDQSGAYRRGVGRQIYYDHRRDGHNPYGMGDAGQQRVSETRNDNQESMYPYQDFPRGFRPPLPSPNDRPPSDPHGSWPPYYSEDYGPTGHGASSFEESGIPQDILQLLVTAPERFVGLETLQFRDLVVNGFRRPSLSWDFRTGLWTVIPVDSDHQPENDGFQTPQPSMDSPDTGAFVSGEST